MRIESIVLLPPVEQTSERKAVMKPIQRQAAFRLGNSNQGFSNCSLESGFCHIDETVAVWVVKVQRALAFLAASNRKSIVLLFFFGLSSVIFRGYAGCEWSISMNTLTAHVRNQRDCLVRRRP